MTQRVPDYTRPPGADLAYGLSALLCGVLLFAVRWLGRR
jgi:hypothetical protein